MYYWCFRFIFFSRYCYPFTRRCFLASLIVPVFGLASRYVIWFTLWSVIDSTVKNCYNWGQPGIEHGTSRTRSENPTPRPLTVALIWLRLVNCLKLYALIHSFYHELLCARVVDYSRCGLSELQILSASVNFDSLCRKSNSSTSGSVRSGIDGNWSKNFSRREREAHAKTTAELTPLRLFLCIIGVFDLFFSPDIVIPSRVDVSLQAWLSQFLVSPACIWFDSPCGVSAVTKWFNSNEV